MDVFATRPETSHLPGLVEHAARLIERWRSEVADQWGPGGSRIDQAAMVALLEEAVAGGLDPESILWAVLGSEWLFRARPATREDVDAELVKIRGALLKGSQDPNHAILFENVAKPRLRSTLRRLRFLVSYRAFTVPSGLVSMRFAPGRGGKVPTKFGEVRTAVSVRRGPVTKLGPIVAAILVQGMTERITGNRIKSDRFALKLVALLLKRSVILPEFRKWKRRTLVAISDPSPELSESERRRTLRDWLVFRFERIYANTRGPSSWAELCNLAESAPAFAFTCVGDREVARLLYAMNWGKGRSSKKG